MTNPKKSAAALASAPAVQAERQSPMCLTVRQTYNSSAPTLEYFISADWHFDNPKCKRELLFEHLQEAKRRGAFVGVVGDLFCLMQGKYDPRGNKASIRPEHNVANYLDRVIDDTAEKLEPYAANLLWISEGNHETNILKRLETNPTERLIKALRQAGSPVEGLPYMGFVRHRYEHTGGGKIRNCLLYFHHGAWGGVVSKGTQASARYAAIAPQADLIVSGHTHDKWQMELPRIILTESGETQTRAQYHLKCGTYKEEFESGSGWAVEKIVTPKSFGGWFVSVTPQEDGGVKIRCEAAG